MSIVVDTKLQPKRFTLGHLFLLGLGIVLYIVTYFSPFMGNPLLTGREFLIQIPTFLSEINLSVFIIIGLFLSVLSWLLAIFKLKSTSIYLSLAVILLFIGYFVFSLFNVNIHEGYFKLAIGFYLIPLNNTLSLAFNFLEPQKTPISLKGIATYIAILASVIGGGLQFAAKYFELEQDKIKQRLLLEQHKIRQQEIELAEKTERLKKELAEQKLIAQQKIEEEKRLYLEQQIKYQKELEKKQDPLITQAGIITDEYIHTALFQNPKGKHYRYLTSNKFREKIARDFYDAYKDWVYRLYADQKHLITEKIANRSTDAFIYAMQQTSYKIVDSERVSENQFVITLEVQGLSFSPIKEKITAEVSALIEQGKLTEKNFVPHLLKLEADELFKVKADSLLPPKQIKTTIYYIDNKFSQVNMNEILDMGLFQL